MRFVFTLMMVIIFAFQMQGQVYYATDNGEIKFLSDAPLEVIRATSKNLKGIIDKEKNTFAFSIAISSFEGFNSPLQREHFNENYLESNSFPEATFTGKIIEKNALNQRGEITIRAKGKLTIHGVTEERIIKCKLIITEDSIEVLSFFTIFLEDHKIIIPKIVFQKISHEIQVHLDTKLFLKK